MSNAGNQNLCVQTEAYVSGQTGEYLKIVEVEHRNI